MSDAEKIVNIMTKGYREEQERTEGEIEVEKQKREDSLRYAQEHGPKPQPAPPREGPFDPRYPTTIVTELHPTSARDAYGNPPEVIQLPQHEHKVANLANQVADLARRLAAIEDAR